MISNKRERVSRHNLHSTQHKINNITSLLLRGGSRCCRKQNATLHTLIPPTPKNCNAVLDMIVILYRIGAQGRIGPTTITPRRVRLGGPFEAAD